VLLVLDVLAQDLLQSLPPRRNPRGGPREYATYPRGRPGGRAPAWPGDRGPKGILLRTPKGISLLRRNRTKLRARSRTVGVHHVPDLQNSRGHGAAVARWWGSRRAVNYAAAGEKLYETGRSGERGGLHNPSSARRAQGA
jgi:hypothetical protein